MSFDAKQIRNVERLVEHYKPRLETKFGVNLDDVVIKPYSELPEEIKEKTALTIRVYRVYLVGLADGDIDFIVQGNEVLENRINNLEEDATAQTVGNIIYINTKHGDFNFIRDECEKSVLHELLHVVSWKINPYTNLPTWPAEKFDYMKQPPENHRAIFEEVAKVNVISEGFSEHGAFNSCLDCYLDADLNFIMNLGLSDLLMLDFKKRKYEGEPLIEISAPYIVGHYFFGLVCERFGKQAAVKILKNVDKISYEDLGFPERFIAKNPEFLK